MKPLHLTFATLITFLGAALLVFLLSPQVAFLGGGGGGGGGGSQTSYSYSWSANVYNYSDGSFAGYGDVRVCNCVAGGGGFTGGGGGNGGQSSFTSGSGSNPCCATTPTTPTTPTETFPPDEDINTPPENSNTPRVSLYIQKQGGTTWTKTIEVIEGAQVSLRWVTSNTSSCRSTDATEFTVPENSGTSATTDTVEEPTLGQRVYGVSCTGDNGSTVNSTAGITVLLTPLVLDATPSFVRKNETSTLTWDVGSRTGCILQKRGSPTGTSLTTNTGAEDSVPITGETLYTLTCDDGASASATIKMLPVYSET